jgi:putative toxin-antitoxin system antitoxin component (TIGR02293 family)
MNDPANTLDEQRAAIRSAAVEAFDGDATLAESWLNQPIEILGNQRPVDFMDSLERIRILQGVIGRLKDGFP